MGKKRLIPKLLLRSSQRFPDRKVLVTTQTFAGEFEVGDPVSQAKIYEAQAADELLFLDLDQGRGDNRSLFSVLEKVSEEVFMPITVGGGVRTLEDIRICLRSGADKVSLNTAVCEDPSLITKGAQTFGSQCIVVSIDFRKERDSFTVWAERGKKRFPKDLFTWAKEAERLGAGELLLTSIDRDGTRQGLEVDVLTKLVRELTIPVIASGGCGKASHFIDAFQRGGVSGVAAGTFFCFKDENPVQTRSRIYNAGIEIRI